MSKSLYLSPEQLNSTKDENTNWSKFIRSQKECNEAKRMGEVRSNSREHKLHTLCAGPTSSQYGKNFEGCAFISATHFIFNLPDGERHINCLSNTLGLALETLCTINDEVRTITKRV